MPDISDTSKKHITDIRENIIFGVEFTELASGLCLGTDSLLLFAYMKASPEADALEIGAGSGSVSLLSAKKCCFNHIYSIEIQPRLYELMKKNITRNNFDSMITPICGDIRNIKPETFKGVSVIFSNPPYMKEKSGKSSPVIQKQIAKHEVHGGIYDFCVSAGKILKTGGKLYLVYRPDRLETLMHSLKETGFSPKRMTFVHSDATHSPSSVLTESVFDAKESLFITPPLFLKENGTIGADAKYIYGRGKFPDKFFSKQPGKTHKKTFQ